MDSLELNVEDPAEFAGYVDEGIDAMERYLARAKVAYQSEGLNRLMTHLSLLHDDDA